MTHAVSKTSFLETLNRACSFLLFGILALLVSGGWTPARSGQKELMQAWEAKQQDVKNKVYDRLREEGKLPKDGTVIFKARTKRDPGDQEKLLITVDEVQVVPTPEDFSPVAPADQTATTVKGGAASSTPPIKGGAASTSFDTEEGKVVQPTPINAVTIEWHNMDVSDFIKEESLDIPVEQEFAGRFVIRRGVILPAPKEDAQEMQSPPEPTSKGWTTVVPPNDGNKAGLP